MAVIKKILGIIIIILVLDFQIKCLLTGLAYKHTSFGSCLLFPPLLAYYTIIGAKVQMGVSFFSALFFTITFGGIGGYAVSWISDGEKGSASDNADNKSKLDKKEKKDYIKNC